MIIINIKDVIKKNMGEGKFGFFIKMKVFIVKCGKLSKIALDLVNFEKEIYWVKPKEISSEFKSLLSTATNLKLRFLLINVSYLRKGGKSKNFARKSFLCFSYSIKGSSKFDFICIEDSATYGQR